MWKVYVSYSLNGARGQYVFEVEADDREDAILRTGIRTSEKVHDSTVLAVRPVE